MKLSKTEAEDIVYEEHEYWIKIEEKIVGQSRWTTNYSGIFKHIPSERFFKVWYSRGSTEYQETDLFCNDEVEFIEVELKEVLITQWVEKHES